MAARQIWDSFGQQMYSLHVTVIIRFGRLAWMCLGRTLPESPGTDSWADSSDALKPWAICDLKKKKRMGRWEGSDPPREKGVKQRRVPWVWRVGRKRQRNPRFGRRFGVGGERQLVTSGIFPDCSQVPAWVKWGMGGASPRIIGMLFAVAESWLYARHGWQKNTGVWLVTS